MERRARVFRQSVHVAHNPRMNFFEEARQARAEAEKARAAAARANEEAELAEARRLSSDGRYSSMARLPGSQFWPPNIKELAETTFFAGLRKAGMPEE